MAMAETPSSERIHIAFFGMRNAGKSSVMNAFTSQSVSLVSDIAGTTTDPVKKTMELLPLGPVVLTDTAGLDDEGELGTLRVQKTHEVLEGTDIAVLVLDATKEPCQKDYELIATLQNKKIPFVIACNKSDVLSAEVQQELTAKLDTKPSAPILFVSAKTNDGITELKNAVAALKPQTTGKHLVADFIHKGDVVVLVVPIDNAAPKGRLILPQQMALRDILEAGAVPLCCTPQNLVQALEKLQEKPTLVITDSQAFHEVNAALPQEIPLTSFSILMSRYKGTLPSQLEGAATLDSLNDGDRIIISEGCTHHRQCGDIGTVKIPALIKKYTGKNLNCTFTSGGDFTRSLEGIRLVIHCGGCMLTEKEMANRVATCKAQDILVTNYGMAIAKMNGILERALAVVSVSSKKTSPLPRLEALQGRFLPAMSDGKI